MNIQSLERSGWEYLKDGYFDKALEVFSEIYLIDPKNVAAIQGRIACYRKKCDFKTALTLLEEALVIYPDEPGILSEKAWYYLERNEYDQAIKAFNELLKAKKDDPGIFLWQLYLLRRQRNYSEALHLLKEAIALFPGNLSITIEKGWIAFYQSQFEESIQIFNYVAEQEPSNESAFQGKIASLRMQRSHSEALDLSNKATIQFKKSPGIYSERGWINIEMENFDAAVEDFQKVLTLVNNDQYAHINLAWALIKQGSPDNLDKASDHCKIALNIHPDLSEALSCLGNIAFKKGNIREAESYFVRSIKSDYVRGPHADLGALYIQMERYEEAKEQLEQALKNNPEDVYAHLEMGYLNLNTDKIKDAIREFRMATIMDPSNPESFKALGIALTENKNFIEAEKVFRNAINLFDKKKCSGLHLALSQLLTTLGDQTNNSSFYEEALKEVHNAICIKPDKECYFYNGILRYKLEDYKNSLISFNNCLRQDKKYLEAELNANRIKDLMRKEKTLIKSSRSSSVFLTSIFLMQLVFIWIVYFNTTKITSGMVSVLVPVLSGLLIISVLLPWLSRFKLSGIEAELNNPNPKESLASGPKGEMIMSNNLRKLS